MKNLMILGLAAGLSLTASAYESMRPVVEKRCFTSASVEKTIEKVQAKLGDTKMAWLFANCFPNTLDATIYPFLVPSNFFAVDVLRKAAEILRALTTDDETEIKECLVLLEKSDADTGFMHESYDKDDPSQFSRSWFAWANTLFGELILDRVEAGKEVQ